jgi:MoaA/NifB/PqqE/SkfB family radical SAM enzyme
MARSGRMIAKTIGGFLKWKTGARAPLFASFLMSGRCNLNCAFCEWPNLKLPELNTNEALTVIDKVCDLGIPFLQFGGGEPMLRKDLPLIAKRASCYGCFVGMNTNGTLLNRFNVSEMADSFDSISVSVDGPRELHDKFRGAKGTFDKAFEAIKLLRAERVNVGVNVVVAPWNIELLPGFIEWLSGVVDFASLQPIHPYPPPTQNRPSAKAIFDLAQFLREFRHRHPRFLAVGAGFLERFKDFFDGCCPKICHAGELYIAIDSMGGLIPCSARRDVVLGNVLERSPKDILHDRMKNPDWFKIPNCGGCWLLCTSESSLAMQRPLREVVSLSAAVF